MDNYTDIRDFYSLDSMVEHAVDNIRFDKSDCFSVDIIANETIAENISLTSNTEQYCQPDYQKNGNRYNTDADIIYVYEDVKADVLNSIEADEIIIFGIK